MQGKCYCCAIALALDLFLYLLFCLFSINEVLPSKASCFTDCGADIDFQRWCFSYWILSVYLIEACPLYLFFCVFPTVQFWSFCWLRPHLYNLYPGRHSQPLASSYLWPRLTLCVQCLLLASRGMVSAFCVLMSQGCGPEAWGTPFTNFLYPCICALLRF